MATEFPDFAGMVGTLSAPEPAPATTDINTTLLLELLKETAIIRNLLETRPADTTHDMPQNPMYISQQLEW